MHISLAGEVPLANCVHRSTNCRHEANSGEIYSTGGGGNGLDTVRAAVMEWDMSLGGHRRTKM